MLRTRHDPERWGLCVAGTLSNILIVEDEPDLSLLLAYNLKQQGHEIRACELGEDALRQVAERAPDLVLLDLMLPDLSGLEVCRRLKADGATKKIPVVMLTARGEEMDRVAGFEVGADDYVVKPFSVRELMLRVRAVLRRASGEDDESAGPSIELGAIRLEPATHRCFVGGAEVTLTVLEYRLLQFLASRPGKVQTREALLEHVWGITAPQETRTIDTHVMRLREKLGEARGQLETVRGVGYRMTEPATTGG